MFRFFLIVFLTASALYPATKDPALERDLLVGRFQEPESDYRQNYWIHQPVFADENRGHDVNEAKRNVYPSIYPGFYGKQALEFGSVSRVMKSSNLNASFFIGGNRAYEVGTFRGAFIERGIVFGDEAGIWSQPFKILDGILVEVSVDGDPFVALNSADRVVNRMYCMDMYQKVGDILFRRRDFPAVDEWAFLHQLSFKNRGDTRRRVQVRVSFQSNIRPIWHKPWTVEYGKDTIHIGGEGMFVAEDDHIDHVQTAFGLMAAGIPVTQRIDNANPYRPRGIVEFETQLDPGSLQRVDLGSVQVDRVKVARSGKSIAGAGAYLKGLLDRTPALLEERREFMQAAVYGNVRFACPDKTLQDAYYSALYNIASLASDTRPYMQYAHLMTAPERGYQLLFGIDTLYASAGAAASGAREIIRSTLLNHLYYAEEAGNKGIHFYVDHFGRHGDRGGRAQETSQFIGTFWNYVRITGDIALAKASYTQLKALFSAVESLDENGDNWPDGMTFPSLTERAGTETMLSAATRLCWAAQAMSELAAALGYADDAQRYADKSVRLREAFEADWWNPETGMWAAGLIPTGKGHTQVVLDDYHSRSLHYPQTYHVAALEKGRACLREIARRAVDDKGGLHAPAVTVWQNSLMAIGAFQYDLSELGMRLLDRAARNPVDLDKMLGAFSTMNPDPDSLPDNENKIMYCWSAGPFVEAVLFGLMGIEPDALDHSLVFHPRLPSDWETASVLGYRMGDHVVDFSLSDGEWRITHVTGPTVLRMYFGAATKSSILGSGESVCFPVVSPAEEKARAEQTDDHEQKDDDSFE